MYKLNNKNTPLERGVKIPYRDYTLLSCIVAGCLMLLLTFAYSYSENSVYHSIFTLSQSGLVIVFSLTIKRFNDRELIEKKDELSYLNHLKTVRTIAYIAFGTLILFMILSRRYPVPNFTFTFFSLILSIVFFLYAAIFYLIDKKGS